MKTILLATYYQICNFVRVKKAVFFSFVFPVFLYVIFTFVWGNSTERYSKFLLTGIIAITIVSNSILSIGNVIVQYYQDGLIKLFKILPYSFNKHLSTLILSRIILMFIAVSILITFSFVVTKLTLSLEDLSYIFLGIIVGMFIFSLIGILVAEFFDYSDGNSGAANLFFYVLMFLSDAFYPITEMNPVLGKFIRLNPMSPILNLIRHKGEYWWEIIIWSLLLLSLQVICVKFVKIKR